MNRVCVLGSMNMDLVVNVGHMPKVGETILSNHLEKIPGGKGANQAVAAKRSGAEVHMVSKVGRDDNGQILLKELEKDCINTECVFIDENETTGMAIITVDDNGNNSIIVVSGSNMTINKEEIDKCEEVIKNSDIVISQFETPQEMTLEAFKTAKKHEKLTILNPAPAREINEELLKYTDMIIPNETEAFLLTGVNVKDLGTAKEAAGKFFEKGVKWVIITLGEKGAAVISDKSQTLVPAFKVEAKDTTAAGDSFIGALSSRLEIGRMNEQNVVEAVRFGNKVSSIAVQRKGAQPSIPFLKEVNEVYGRNDI